MVLGLAGCPAKIHFNHYNLDSTSNFQELLNKSNSVSVHQKNLQLLLTEIYKTVHNLNPTFITQVFEEKDVLYNFRESNSFTLHKSKKTLHGIDTVRYIRKNYDRYCQQKSKSPNH